MKRVKMVLLRRHVLLVGLCVCAAGCWAAGYGPTVDRSRFVSARLNEAGLVLYTAQDLAYRPATGWRAYPDGGIPLYVRDRNVIGCVDSATGRTDVLHARRNTEWQHGQGQLNIHDFQGDIAVIVESGQRRTDYLTGVRYYLLRVSRRELTPMPLKEDFQARGRDVGYFYLLDSRGTLLFVTPPLDWKGSRVDTATDEIWLRRPSGQYTLVARHADYYGQSAGELVYWQLDERVLQAFNVAAGSTRSLARDPTRAAATPAVAVAISTDGTALNLTRRLGDTWHTESTLLTLDKAK